MTDVAVRLTNCFAGVFPNVAPDIVRQGSVETIQGWDSMAFIQLIMQVEQEFDINIKLEEIASLTSFPRIMEYLQGAVVEGA